MIEHTNDTHQEREHEIPVPGRMIGHSVRQFIQLAQTGFVYEFDARDPVSVQDAAISLYIVLSACKIPHEITQVHMSDLVSKEKPEVLTKGWLV